MSTTTEIETALKKLPLKEAQDIAQWLERYLNEQATAKTQLSGSIQLPNYAMRRQMIFGEKMLPNMVMLGRDEERW